MQDERDVVIAETTEHLNGVLVYRQEAQDLTHIEMVSACINVLCTLLLMQEDQGKQSLLLSMVLKAISEDVEMLGASAPSAGEALN